jgi:predicted XRE-type DNA-binding protein
MLAELEMLLASDQLPVQEEVAEAAGVHQSLVSRARNGQLKRITGKVEALLEYARSRVDAEQVAAAAAKAIEVDLAKVPESSVADDEPVTGTRRSARRRVDAAVDGYRRQARDGVETYLNEGYDPRLIVEQLVVLRRAQRLRRPGREPIASIKD